MITPTTTASPKQIMAATKVKSAGVRNSSPQLAVDQSTGTLVATWYDGRYDAARGARGGVRRRQHAMPGRPSRQTYLNSPGVVINPVSQVRSYATAYDEITGQNVNLQPIPENFSGADSLTDPTSAFGDHEGLAVDGRQYRRDLDREPERRLWHHLA